MRQVGGVHLQAARALPEHERLRVVLLNPVQHRMHHLFGAGLGLGDRGCPAKCRQQTIAFFPKPLLDIFKNPQQPLNAAEVLLLQIGVAGSL